MGETKRVLISMCLCLRLWIVWVCASLNTARVMLLNCVLHNPQNTKRIVHVRMIYRFRQYSLCRFLCLSNSLSVFNELHSSKQNDLSILLPSYRLTYCLWRRYRKRNPKTGRLSSTWKMAKELQFRKKTTCFFIWKLII